MAVVITRRAGGQYGFVWSSVFVPNSGSVSDQTRRFFACPFACQA
jgi:hypothetical protein